MGAGSAGGQGPGGLDVLAHLGDQGRHRVELGVAAQAGGELDGGVGAVQVQVVAVQRVGLHGAVGAVEGGVGADRDRGGPAGELGAVQVQDNQGAGVEAVVGGARGGEG